MNPFPLKYLPIWPVILAFTMLLIMIVPAFIFPAILPDMEALSMHLVIEPLTFVISAVLPFVLALTV